MAGNRLNPQRVRLRTVNRAHFDDLSVILCLQLLENEMERKTPATQVQEALTLIGRLFVQETDRVDAVNRELRRDLDGTCLTLRQTEDAAQAKLDAAMEMLEASRRECNEYREKAFRLQNAVDSLRTRLQASEMRGYELERQLEECAPYASKYPVLLAAYKMVCRDVSAE